MISIPNVPFRWYSVTANVYALLQQAPVTFVNNVGVPLLKPEFSCSLPRPCCEFTAQVSHIPMLIPHRWVERMCNAQWCSRWCTCFVTSFVGKSSLKNEFAAAGFADSRAASSSKSSTRASGSCSLKKKLTAYLFNISFSTSTWKFKKTVKGQSIETVLGALKRKSTCWRFDERCGPNYWRTSRSR